MTTTFTPNLGLADPQPLDSGTNNTWGTLLNNNFNIIDTLLTAPAIDISGKTTYTLTTSTNAVDQRQPYGYRFTGTLSAPCTVTIPSTPRLGWVVNLTNGGQNVTVKTAAVGGTTNVTIPPTGAWYLFNCDGQSCLLAVMGAVTEYISNQAFFSSNNIAPALNNVQAAACINMRDGFGAQFSTVAKTSPSQPSTCLTLNANWTPAGQAGGLIAFRSNGADVGNMSTNGTSVSLNTLSDYRAKHIFGPADGRLIRDIRVYDAAFKPKLNDRRPMVIAHELEEVAPWAVQGKKDGLMFQTVDYSKLIAPLIAYVQDLENRLERAELQIEALRRADS